MPETAGETLSGKPIVLAKALHGHAAVLIAGFSRAGGAGTGDWVKSIHTDPAFNGVDVYQIAMLAGAPSLLRGMIRSSMKRGLSPAQQVNFVILTDDEKLWRAYFEVSADDEPYVLLIDEKGKVLWHGHGQAASLEPQLKAALHQAHSLLLPGVKTETYSTRNSAQPCAASSTCSAFVVGRRF